MKNSKSENSELSLSEKLEKVEKLRKTCLKKIDDVIDVADALSIEVRLSPKQGELYAAAEELGWTEDSGGFHSWMESTHDRGYTVIFSNVPR